MDNLDYIDDYFNGRLDDPQKAAFDQLILSDPPFAEKVAFYVTTHQILKQELEEEKKERWREIFEQNKATPAFNRPAGTVRKLWISLAAAAAVLIVVIGLWWTLIRPVGPYQLAENYISQKLQKLPVKMGSRQDEIQKARSSYNNANFPEALRQFEHIISQSSDNEEAIRFAGLVCLRLKDYDKALLYFQRSENIPGLYANPAKFYQALTLMERNGPGDAQKAKTLLQQVVDQDLEHKQEARRFLDRW